MELDLTNLLGQLTITAITLGIAALGYSAWFASGVANAAIKTKTWSWKRTFTDLGKVALAVYVVFAVVIGFNLIKMVASVIGADISMFTSVLSTTVVAGTALIGAANFFMKAITNVWALWKFTQIDMKDVKADSEVDFNKVGQQTIDFFDTITNKTSKEDIESYSESAPELFDYEEVDAGKGGVTDTYPAKYKNPPQDSLLDPSTCYNRECVSYTAWKVAELTGKWPTRTGGMNAKYWVQRLAENGYTKVVAAPQNGGKYVGVSTAGQYGHVVWFEEGTTISEYNYLYRGGFSVRNINLSAYTWVEIKAPAGLVDTDYAAGEKKSDQEIADEVIAGKWGNGDDRKARLSAAGYNYDTIQAIVNAKLAPKTTPPTTKKSETFKVGDAVAPIKPVDYTGHALRQFDSSYIITQLSGNRAVLSARGAIWGALNVSNLRKV